MSAAAQINTPSVLPAETNTLAVAHGLVAEAQWRPSSIPSKYPLLEVYLRNLTDQPIEWKRALLNGEDLPSLAAKRSVLWWDFYPTSQNIPPGESCVLQVCLPEPPKESMALRIEADHDRSVQLNALLFRAPAERIAGVAFSSNFHKVFLTWQSKGRPKHPVELLLNNRPAPFQVWAAPSGRGPGMIAADAPCALKAGQAVHLRLTFEAEKPSDQERNRKASVPQPPSTAEILLRAYHAVSLNAFGVGERDLKLRTDLHLDARPAFRMIGLDPACADIKSPAQPGRTMAQILAKRRQWYLAGDDRLCWDYLCTSANNDLYAIYANGGGADAMAINPYKLHYGGDKRMINSEEGKMRAVANASPRPWGWLAEAFTSNRNQRMLEPLEYRALALAALGHGAKFFSPFIWNSPGMNGFSKSKPLLDEISAVNTEIKTLESLLAPSLPLSEETIGTRTDGIRVYTLWAGEAGGLVIVRNLHTTDTDRSSNQLGATPRFQVFPKTDARIPLPKMAWLEVAQAQDAMTHEPIPWKTDAQGGELTLKRLDVGKIIWLQPKTKASL